MSHVHLLHTDTVAIHHVLEAIDPTWRMRLGSVELEKLRLAMTRFGMAWSVEVSVMVFPDPGGPQRIRGLCDASHALSTSTCLQQTHDRANEQAY